MFGGTNGTCSRHLLVGAASQRCSRELLVWAEESALFA
jgi:hypothetical protein